MTSLTTLVKEVFPPPSHLEDKCQFVLYVTGAGQPQGQSYHGDGCPAALSPEAKRGCCYGNQEGTCREQLEPVSFTVQGSWIWREAKLKGGDRETEAQQNACMLEEGPSQNESTVGYRIAGTPNCQAAVARLGRINLIFSSVCHWKKVQ